MQQQRSIGCQFNQQWREVQLYCSINADSAEIRSVSEIRNVQRVTASGLSSLLLESAVQNITEKKRKKKANGLKLGTREAAKPEVG